MDVLFVEDGEEKWKKKKKSTKPNPQTKTTEEKAQVKTVRERPSNNLRKR